RVIIARKIAAHIEKTQDRRQESNWLIPHSILTWFVVRSFRLSTGRSKGLVERGNRSSTERRRPPASVVQGIVAKCRRRRLAGEHRSDVGPGIVAVEGDCGDGGRRWEMGDGRWELGDGRWERGVGGRRAEVGSRKSEGGGQGAGRWQREAKRRIGLGTRDGVQGPATATSQPVTGNQQPFRPGVRIYLLYQLNPEVRIYLL